MTNDIFQSLENANKSADTKTLWKGTFREFLQKFESDKNTQTNVGALAHQRIFNMIMAYGTEKIDHFGKERIKYKFFEDTLYGIEDAIDGLMSYFNSASQKTETARRMLLMYGPPSSGKSNLVQCIKRGLENYTRTSCGAIYSLEGSKMHENPFLLIPETLRPDFEKQYGSEIEGTLSPHSAWRLLNEYKGKFMDFPVEQIYLDEATRCGIGTFLPGDQKTQDQAELVGSVDFAKIQEFGDEADPRAYNFNGELNIANRGVMDFIEALKCVSASTRIPTDQGLIRIADLHGDLREELVAAEQFVETSNGFDRGRIIRSCYKGKEQSVSCVTQKGYKLEGSKFHRILAVDQQDNLEWKNLGDLNAGDKVLMTTGSFWSKNSPSLPIKEKHLHGNRNHISIPKHLNRHLARLLGYFTAEGSYSKHGDIKYSVRISNVDDEIIQDLRTIAESLEIKAAYYQNERSTSLHSRELCCLFERLGFGDISSSDDKIVPEVIFRSPARIVAEYLSAYFDGDGTVTDHDISCTSSSEQLMIDIQLLLLNFGIVCRRTKFWNENYQKNYHYLYISSVHYDRFIDEIGFLLTRKQQAAVSRRQTRKNHRDTLPVQNIFKNIHSILKQVSEETNTPISPKQYSPKQEKPETHLVSRKTYNDVWAYATGARVASRPSISGLVSELSLLDCLVKQVSMLEDLLSAPLFVDEVETITELGLQEVFDVHETTKHSYAAHGFINHNSDERLLRVLLTVTQEKAIKAPRFGLIYCDAAVLLHSNEEEFRNFMAEKKYEAYHDRMVIVKVPYNLSVSNEVKIYNKLLENSDATKKMNIAPKTLDAAAMFAILSRLTAPPESGDLTLVKKMKLYDKQHVRGHKIEQVPILRKKDPHEGMTGASPRFVIDQISAAISTARDEDRDYVTALDVLRQLNKGVRGRESFAPDKKNHYESLVDMARQEWDDMLKNDIQKAFFVCYEDEARSLCENYLDQIEAACASEKPRDPVTGEETELDNKLMDSIEEQIEISNSGKDDFRNEILRAVGTASRKHRKFDYTEHAQLREAIQKKLFEERKNVIRMTVSARNPDDHELKKINEVVARMVDQQGYSTGAANALLKYASAHLFDK